MKLSRFALLLTLAFPAALFAQTRQVTILQTTDLHDHANGSDHVGFDENLLTATGILGSYARIAGYVGYVRQNTKHPVVLVDSGDWTMGTVYDLTLGSKPLALQFMDLMHYDVATLGNHEFDYTTAGLAQILSKAQSSFHFDVPIVASNMNLNGDPNLAPFVGAGKPIQTTYVETLSNGLKIGYIGLMGESAATDAAASAPVTFSPLSKSYTAIQTMVNSLRSNGADMVIALSHSGTSPSGTSGEDVDLAQHVTGIDVIESGHTHTPLDKNHAVKNGTWTTQIVDAGAYGTNVFRLDLTVDSSAHTTSVDGATNVSMNDASLLAVSPRIRPDPIITWIVGKTDEQIHKDLGPFFRANFPAYNPNNLATGLYQPVAVSAQEMVSNTANDIPGPNGLGDLAADAERAVPNSIIAATLAQAGKPENLPGYDFTPFQVGVVATGVLRTRLRGGVPLSFADIYDVLSLGISPDQSQQLPIGYPMISIYVDPADLKDAMALQLVAQTGLVNPDFYLNFSGVRYSLDAAAAYTYFKNATAAGVLQTTSSKAAAGSTAAQQALGALQKLGTDSGASLLALYAQGNPYAVAMVNLNDATPTQAQIAVNLQTLGQVAFAAASGAVAPLIVSKAVAAIDKISAFSPTDLKNVGAAVPLGTSRVRVAVDLYALYLLGAVQQQYGITIVPYASATATTPMTTADILANRIDATPFTPGIQELKEWMALLGYVTQGLGGWIASDYQSTTKFAQFPLYGFAVQNRDANYPLLPIGQLAQTLGGLAAAP